MANRISLIIDVATEKANSALKNFKSSVAEAEGFTKKLKAGASSAFQGISTSVKAMGAAAVGSFVAFGDDIAEAGVKMAALDAKARTVFGDSLGLVQAWADANAAAMGSTSRAAVGAAAGIQDLLVPMGFTRDAATQMSIKLLDLSGALSAWSGGTRSAAEVSQILTKAMLGEREQLKELGISILDADVKARLAKKGQEGLTGAALEQAKAIATQELILEKSTDAQKAWVDGSMDATKAANQSKAGFAELSDKLNEELYPAIEALIPLVTKIAETVGIVFDAAKGSGAEFRTEFKKVGDTLDKYEDQIDKTGHKLKWWRDQVLDGKMTLDQAIRSIQIAAKANQDMLTVLDGGERSWEQAASNIRSVADAAKNSQNTMAGYSYAAKDAADTTKRLADEADSAKERGEAYAESVKRQTDRVKDLYAAERSLVDARMASQDASADAADKVTDYNNALAKRDATAGMVSLRYDELQRATEDYNRVAGQSAVTDEEKKIRDEELKIVEDNLRLATDNYQDSIRDSQSALEAVEPAQRAANQALLEASERQAEATGAALDSEAGVRAQIAALEGLRDTLAPGGPLRSFLDQWIAALLAIPSKVTTTLETNTSQGSTTTPQGDVIGRRPIPGKWTPFAEGGMVPGPRGTPVPAIVHGGEAVLTPEQQTALGNGHGNSYVIQLQMPVVASQSDYYRAGQTIKAAIAEYDRRNGLH